MPGPMSEPTTAPFAAPVTAPAATPDDRVLAVRSLRKEFPVTSGLLRRTRGSLRAVDDVSFDLGRGETLALVGESGSGKTTLGRAVVRAIDPSSGEILLRTDDGDVDLARMRGRALRERRRDFHMIFQDPYSSLDPRMTVLGAVREPLVQNRVGAPDERRDRVVDVLERVGLSARHLHRYPHAFSGGQRQRIGIARSLVCDPRFVVADEAVSALDVSVQAQILNLLKDLQGDLGLSYLFIAHDLAVVQFLAHRVAVMYAGRIVELADTDALFGRPAHPYTEALLSAMPVPEPRQSRERIVLSGEPANAAALPSGCVFHPRCRYAVPDCAVQVPELRVLASGHAVACHRADELALQGTGAV
ncbi:ABC transporter ATP-binding protein [Isoptericola sp. NPDC057191]|uniref:ABC transporter ATP-binding protein n=1 Tax=Isoptericola sp. NPDC057191 TaxID=3346041 RepID=UPI003632AFFB